LAVRVRIIGVENEKRRKPPRDFSLDGLKQIKQAG